MNTANPMGRGANTLIAKKKREQKIKIYLMRFFHALL
jgi:hypothetical protein